MPDAETDPVVVNSSHTLLFVVSDSDSDDSGEVIDVDPERPAPTDIEVCHHGKCLRSVFAHISTTVYSLVLIYKAELGRL